MANAAINKIKATLVELLAMSTGLVGVRADYFKSEFIGSLEGVIESLALLDTCNLEFIQYSLDSSERTLVEAAQFYT